MRATYYARFVVEKKLFHATHNLYYACSICFCGSSYFKWETFYPPPHHLLQKVEIHVAMLEMIFPVVSDVPGKRERNFCFPGISGKYWFDKYRPKRNKTK